MAVAARENGFGIRSVRTAVRRCAYVYRTEMENFAQMRFLDIWCSRIDVDQVSQLFDGVKSPKAIRRRNEDVERACRHTSVQALEKLCHLVDGQYRIKPVPPVVVGCPLPGGPLGAGPARAGGPVSCAGMVGIPRSGCGVTRIALTGARQPCCTPC